MPRELTDRPTDAARGRNPSEREARTGTVRPQDGPADRAGTEAEEKAPGGRA